MTLAFVEEMVSFLRKAALEAKKLKPQRPAQSWQFINLKNILLRVIPTMAFNSSHLTFCRANLLAFCLAFYLAYLLTFYLAYLLTFYLAFSTVEVRRGPQCSESRRLRPTAIESWQWRASEANCDPELAVRSGCDQELAVEVSRGPLRSRAGSGGPARPTAIESWQWRSGEAHCDQELAEEVRRGRQRRRSRRRSRAGHLT